MIFRSDFETIAYATKELSRRLHDPRVGDWQALTRLSRFLSDKEDYVVVTKCNEIHATKHTLEAQTDVNWGSDEHGKVYDRWTVEREWISFGTRMPDATRLASTFIRRVRVTSVHTSIVRGSQCQLCGERARYRNGRCSSDGRFGSVPVGIKVIDRTLEALRVGGPFRLTACQTSSACVV